MKNKIVFSSANEDSGICAIGIQNKYGKFFGYSYCSDEDMEANLFSPYVGYRYAETKAGIEFAKYRLKQEKIKLKTVKNLINDFNSMNICKDDCAYAHTKKMIKVYSENIKYYTDAIDILKTSIKKQDEERQKILLRTNKNK